MWIVRRCVRLTHDLRTGEDTDLHCVVRSVRRYYPTLGEICKEEEERQQPPLRSSNEKCWRFSVGGADRRKRAADADYFCPQV
mgnify:CR=1 FL=1